MSEWLDEFAKTLGTRVKGCLMDFPLIAGNGFGYAKSLGNGISYVYMNCVFNQEFIFDRTSSNESGIMLYFNQVDISHYYKVSSAGQEVIDFNKKRNSVFLGSIQVPLTITFTAGSRLRMVGIRFSDKIVRKFLKSDKFIYIRNYTKQNLKNANKDVLTPDVRRLLNEIYDSDISTQMGELIMQNRVLLLVEKYIQVFLEKERAPLKKRTISLHEQESLEKIEQLLSNTNKDFPSIQALSRMAMMSSTKLKNRFRETYGMKLYEYYNHNRLSRAKNWIESGETNIKEAAYRIGFSNLSNFSKAFKKEFGMLPSEARPEIRVKSES